MSFYLTVTAIPYIESLPVMKSDFINRLDIEMEDYIEVNVLYTVDGDIKKVSDSIRSNKEDANINDLNVLFDLVEGEEPYITFKVLTEDLLNFSKGHYGIELHLPIDYKIN